MYLFFQFIFYILSVLPFTINFIFTWNLYPATLCPCAFWCTYMPRNYSPTCTNNDTSTHQWVQHVSERIWHMSYDCVTFFIRFHYDSMSAELIIIFNATFESFGNFVFIVVNVMPLLSIRILCHIGGPMI